jgi:hypothetical protein
VYPQPKPLPVGVTGRNIEERHLGLLPTQHLLPLPSICCFRCWCAIWRTGIFAIAAFICFPPNTPFLCHLYVALDTQAMHLFHRHLYPTRHRPPGSLPHPLQHLYIAISPTCHHSTCTQHHLIPISTTPCAGKPARNKHAPRPAAARTCKPSSNTQPQPTQTIEIPGGQGDTFEIDLLHEDEWTKELVTHMDKGFNSWEDAGTQNCSASPLKWLLNGSSRATPGLGSRPLNEPDRDHDERTPNPRFSSTRRPMSTWV